MIAVQRNNVATITCYVHDNWTIAKLRLVNELFTSGSILKVATFWQPIRPQFPCGATLKTTTAGRGGAIDPRAPDIKARVAALSPPSAIFA
jgi:hypothetical protein